LHGDGLEDSLCRQVQETLEEAELRCAIVRIPSERSFGEALQEGVQLADGEYIVKMDDDDHYGAGFLEDAVHTMEISDAAVVGKGALLLGIEESQETYLVGLGREYRYWPEGVSGATMLIRGSVFQKVRWRPSARSVDYRFCQDCFAAGLPVMQGNRFHFKAMRRKAMKHTWAVGSRVLKRGPRVLKIDSSQENLFLLD